MVRFEWSIMQEVHRSSYLQAYFDAVTILQTVRTQHMCQCPILTQFSHQATVAFNL